MQHGRVHAGADDGRVGRALGAIFAEDLAQERVDLVFVAAGFGEVHGAEMRVARDRGGLSHRVELVVRLVEAHLVEESRGVDDLRRPRNPSTGTRTRRVERGDHLVVERAIFAEAEHEPIVALEIVRQPRGELVHRKGRVGTEVADRSLDACARAVPHFALRVARSDEEHRVVLGMRARQDEHRVRLVEPGQIEEVRVLPVLVLDVVVPNRHGRRRQHRDTALELGQQSLAAFDVTVHRVWHYG